jgi:hypothetical protein
VFTADNNSSTSKQVRHLRQSVSLTGLGTPYFDEVISGIKDVLTTFSRCVAVDKLAPCNLVDTCDNYTSIDLSNRYFSPKKDVPDELRIPLTKDIDPKGYLALAAGKNYVHSENNVVRYYKYSTGSDGNKFVFNTHAAAYVTSRLIDDHKGQSNQGACH